MNHQQTNNSVYFWRRLRAVSRLWQTLCLSDTDLLFFLELILRLNLHSSRTKLNRIDKNKLLFLWAVPWSNLNLHCPPLFFLLNLIGFSQPQTPVLGWQLYQRTNNRTGGGLKFRWSHQLTVFQRVDQLSVLAGEDGSRQVEHHTHGRQQHEERDLPRRGRGEREQGWRQNVAVHQQQRDSERCLESRDSVELLSSVHTEKQRQRKYFILKDFLKSDSLNQCTIIGALNMISCSLSEQYRSTRSHPANHKRRKSLCWWFTEKDFHWFGY